MATTGFIPPEEREAYHQLVACYMDDLQAAWRLHRCAMIERQPITEDTDPTELRRVQSERVYRAAALPKSIDTENFGNADCRKLNIGRLAQNKANRESPSGVPVEDKANTREEMGRGYQETVARVEAKISKQTQSIGKQFPRNPLPLRIRRKVQALPRNRRPASPQHRWKRRMTGEQKDWKPKCRGHLQTAAGAPAILSPVLLGSAQMSSMARSLRHEIRTGTGRSVGPREALRTWSPR
jgi:hypothetical protein